MSDKFKFVGGDMYKYEIVDLGENINETEECADCC